MDEDIIDDILTVSGLSDSGKANSFGNPSTNQAGNPVQQKIYNGAQRARSAGYDVPDDVADDFYNLTSLESGHKHYLANGQVKLGVRTPNGDQAIGFSQVMGNTAKPYRAKGLNPYDETDNIAIGLNEFAKGGSDPIARRIAYAGGLHSQALKYYQRTGQVPGWKLYSYIPGNKETFRSYVEGTGGFSHPDSQPLSGDALINGILEKSGLNSFAQPANPAPVLAPLPLPAAAPVANTFDASDPNMIDHILNKSGLSFDPPSAAPNPAVAQPAQPTDISGNLANLKTQLENDLKGAQTPAQREVINRNLANLNKTIREQGQTLSIPAAATLPLLPTTQEDADAQAVQDKTAQRGMTDFAPLDTSAESADLAALPTAQKGVSDFAHPVLPAAQNQPVSAQATAAPVTTPQAQLPLLPMQPTDADYRQYLNYAKLPDTPANKQKFLDAQKGDFSVSVNNRLDNAVATEKPNQGATPTNQTIAQPLDSTPSVAVPVSQEGQGEAGKGLVDLTQKPAGENTGRYLLRNTLAQVAPKYGLSKEDVDRYIESLDKKGEKYSANFDQLTDKDIPAYAQSLKNQFGDTNVEFSVLNNDISKIKALKENYNPEEQAQKNIQAENQAAEREAARQKLIDDRSGSILDVGSYSAGLGAAAAGAKDYQPTDEEIDQQIQSDKRARIDDDTREQARGDADWLNKNAGSAMSPVTKLFLTDEQRNNIAASAVGGFMNSAGGVYRTLAGIARPYSGSAYELLSRIADKSETLGGATGNDDNVSQIVKFTTALPVNASELYLATRLPGAAGSVIGFGLLGGLKKAGQGGSNREILKEGAKQAALGAVFEAATPLGKFAEGVAKNGTASLADAFPNAVEGIRSGVKYGVTYGSIIGGSAGVETATGTSPKDALKVGTINALTHLVGAVGEKAFNQTYRATDAKGNVEYSTVTPDNKVRELVGNVENDPNTIDLHFNEKSGQYEAATAPASRAQAPQSQPAAESNGNLFKGQSESGPPPRELAEKNPLRIETPDAEAVARVQDSVRAQKVSDILGDGKPQSIESLTKATRYSPENVTKAIEDLYGARHIEILPDNSVRLISAVEKTQPTGLYEKFKNQPAPSEPIRLQASDIENNAAGNTSAESADKPNVPTSAEPSAVDLPQTKTQEPELSNPQKPTQFAEREDLGAKLNDFAMNQPTGGELTKVESNPLTAKASSLPNFERFENIAGENMPMMRVETMKGSVLSEFPVADAVAKLNKLGIKTGSGGFHTGMDVKNYGLPPSWAIILETKPNNAIRDAAKKNGFLLKERTIGGNTNLTDLVLPANVSVNDQDTAKQMFDALADDVEQNSKVGSKVKRLFGVDRTAPMKENEVLPSGSDKQSGAAQPSPESHEMSWDDFAGVSPSSTPHTGEPYELTGPAAEISHQERGKSTFKTINELEKFVSSKHREVVEKALDEGKAVPSHVLEDYPELAKRDDIQFTVPGTADHGARFRQQESLLSRHINRYAKVKTPDESLVKAANIEVKDGDLMLNAPAAELFRRMIGKAGGVDHPTFFGMYLPPTKTFDLSSAAYQMRRHGLKDFDSRVKMRDIERKIEEASDNPHKDLIAVVDSKAAPLVTKYGHQEEKGHRADYRTRDFAKSDLSPFRDVDGYTKALSNVMRDYPDVSPSVLHNEVIAKTFRDDAVETLGVSQEKIDAIQAKYYELQYDKDVKYTTLEKEFEKVASDKSQRFLENAKREFERRTIEDGRQKPNEIRVTSERQRDLRAGSNSESSTIAQELPVNRFNGVQSDGIQQPAAKAGNSKQLTDDSKDAALSRPSLTRRVLNGIDKKLENKRYFSSVRALEGVINKNLQQLRVEDEDAYEQVLKLAGTQSEAVVEALHGAPITAAAKNALRIQNAADVLTTLQTAGLAVPVLPNQPTPTVVAGKTASVIHIGSRAFAMPFALARELRPVFDKTPDNGAVTGFNKLVNKVGIAGVLGASYHTYNLVSTIIGATPYAGTDMLSRTVGNLPFTKWATSMIHIMAADPEKADVSELREMAHAGVIPTSYGGETYSKKFEALLGSHRKTVSLGPFLHGPKGLDIRTRLVMWRIGKHINPKASVSEMSDFVNQLGIYNRALESQLARSMKGAHIAPFYTAGSAMYKNAALTSIGKSPMPTDGTSFGYRAGLRLQQQLGGTLGLLALWIAVSYVYRGLLPWNDKESRFLSIPLNPNHRHMRWFNKSGTKTLIG